MFCCKATTHRLILFGWKNWLRHGHERTFRRKAPPPDLRATSDSAAHPAWKGGGAKARCGSISSRRASGTPRSCCRRPSRTCPLPASMIRVASERDLEQFRWWKCGERLVQACYWHFCFKIFFFLNKTWQIVGHLQTFRYLLIPNVDLANVEVT